MNWADLRLFLAVARTGSISGAAQKIGRAAFHRFSADVLAGKKTGDTFD